MPNTPHSSLNLSIFTRGTSSPGPPCTLTGGDPDPAPFAWLVRSRSLAGALGDRPFEMLLERGGPDLFGRRHLYVYRFPPLDGNLEARAAGRADAGRRDNRRPGPR